MGEWVRGFVFNVERKYVVVSVKINFSPQAHVLCQCQQFRCHQYLSLFLFMFLSLKICLFLIQDQAQKRVTLVGFSSESGFLDRRSIMLVPNTLNNLMFVDINDLQEVLSHFYGTSKKNCDFPQRLITSSSKRGRPMERVLGQEDHLASL